jgi:hypothetical protein
MVKEDMGNALGVERLMNLLTALDQDVEIVIRRKPRSRPAGRITPRGVRRPRLETTRS